MSSPIHSAAICLGWPLQAARRCAAAWRRRGPDQVVIIVPGIMGSLLGRVSGAGERMVWLNPAGIVRGRIDELKLGNGAPPLVPLRLAPFVYTGLKMRLRAAGFRVEVHAYDWRMDLRTLGAQLAERLRTVDAARILLVAHSMGGLVARAALAQGAERVAKVVLLGPPNHGSFVPVDVLRGRSRIVRSLARLDGRRSAETLAETVFGTFPSLYELLPDAERFPGIDFFDARQWLAAGPRPDAGHLRRACTARAKLAPADARFYLIAGVNRETVVGARCDETGCHPMTSRDGDGTVPLASALLAGVPAAHTYRVAERHGRLPANAAAVRAVADLLTAGHTRALPLLGSV